VRPPSPQQRFEWLSEAARLVQSERAQFEATIIAETGFTTKDAATEVSRAVGTLQLCAEEAKRIGGEVVPVAAQSGSENRIAFTMRFPVGVVCAISPFNSPLNTVCHKVGPALAAGNAVVLKPATATPLTAALLCDALVQAGIPAGGLNMVVGSGATVGERLLRDRRIRCYTFTGSTEVGARIKSLSHVARIHLELGANSPTIILEDADLNLATSLITRAGFRKAGQVCTSVQRILVQQSVADRFADLLISAVSALHTGDPRRPDTDVGPMISVDAAERAEAAIHEAVVAGATLRTGGQRQGSLLWPTILDHVTPTMRVAQDEAFAPLVCLIRVKSPEEAVALANATPYGLQAGVFTRDIDLALSMAQSLEFGGVMINDTSSYHADLMPYGGVKDSGFGLEGPHYAIQEMTAPRIVVVNVGARLHRRTDDGASRGRTR
jgi:acyl-CoA reductase-like NAD-dependent aldehyde dehydrogenase